MNDRATNSATCKEARQALDRYYRSGWENWYLEESLLIQAEKCCEGER